MTEGKEIKGKQNNNIKAIHVCTQRPLASCRFLERKWIARVQRVLYFPQLLWALEFIWDAIASTLVDTAHKQLLRARPKSQIENKKIHKIQQIRLNQIIHIYTHKNERNTNASTYTSLQIQSCKQRIQRENNTHAYTEQGILNTIQHSTRQYQTI